MYLCLFIYAEHNTEKIWFSEFKNEISHICWPAKGGIDPVPFDKQNIIIIEQPKWCNLKTKMFLCCAWINSEIEIDLAFISPFYSYNPVTHSASVIGRWNSMNNDQLFGQKWPNCV